MSFVFHNSDGSRGVRIVLLLCSFVLLSLYNVSSLQSSILAGGSMDKTNRLINEKSPYLLQHAHNPVNWYPFGTSAFSLAKSENKPIFLSIGYSACHWCHVMEEESFENEEIAKLLNDNFISIKVDREERPDVDQVYMAAVQMLTGSGGWPLSVFLTPDLKPFYGGTYFPPEDKYGRPGFKTVLTEIAKAWKNDKKNIELSANSLTITLKNIAKAKNIEEEAVTGLPFKKAADDLRSSFDSKWGGFGGAPKFPPSGKLLFLLRQYKNTGDKSLLNMVTTTLDKMSAGGMYDKIGGGFHRYSVDKKWLVPHFEKMLYDNALLSAVYINAFQVTHNPEYKKIVNETLNYVEREMTAPNGGFYSSQDADSEGEEGLYYVWTPEQIEEILGKKGAQIFNKTFGFTEHGNFEGKNIPRLSGKLSDANQINKMVEKLREAREKRVPPAKDTKIITAWNGLMISAFARSAAVFDNDKFLRTAQNSADFILSNLFNDEILYHSYSKNKKSGPGFLDDYVYMIEALVDLYEADFNIKWLNNAEKIADILISGFWDEKADCFAYASDAHKHLQAKFKPSYDRSIPSGNAIAAMALQKLSVLIGKKEYKKKAEAIMKRFQSEIKRSPTAFSFMLCAMDFYLQGAEEFAIIGEDNAKSVFSVIYNFYLPNKIIAFSKDGSKETLPLLKNKKSLNGKTTVYMCKDYHCEAPITSIEELKKTLAK